MEEKICKCGCGEKLRSDNQTGYRTGHKPAGGGNGTVKPKQVSKNGGSRFADTIALLREDRDRIDRVIGELEKMS